MRWAVPLAALFLLPVVAAHLPQIPEDNTSLATAYTLTDPSVPIAVYGELAAASPRYYRLDLSAGERVPLLLFVPPDETIASPRLVLLSPSGGNETPPEFVEVPPGYGARLVVGSAPRAPEFEPLTPSAYRTVLNANLDASVAGAHYVVVYDFGSTRFGIAVGAGERANLADWSALPLRRADLYEWEGQSAVQWLAPSVVAGSAVAAFLVARWRKRYSPSPYEVIGGAAGALMIAASPTLVYETAWAATRANPTLGILALAILVAVAPMILGALLVALALRDPARITPKTRALVALLGVAGFAAFAGFGAAPWMALLAAFLPADRIPKDEPTPRA